MELISKYQTSLEENNDFLAYMQENNGDAQEAAIYFLKKYPERWKSWILEEAAPEGEQALNEVN